MTHGGIAPVDAFKRVLAERFGSPITDHGAKFRSASPFPHVVVDDVLDLDTEAVESFPTADWSHWASLGTSYERFKFVCPNRWLIPAPWGEVLDELQSGPFLQLLERITGIERLIPDPYLEGGGLHLSTGGGILAPHTDFHLYRRLGLYRRVNILVYLNPVWRPGDGGELELMHAKRPDNKVRIDPRWGRCVIFETSDISVHGFTNPVRQGAVRRSLALYYYTSTEATLFSGDATTHWREHGIHHGMASARMVTSAALMHISRGFSLLAHLANPNQGLAWWETRKERLRKHGSIQTGSG